MRLTGKEILEVTQKLFEVPVEGVLLKHSSRIRETGELREFFKRIDSRNSGEVYDVDDFELVPMPNMGSLNLILSKLKNSGGG